MLGLKENTNKKNPAGVVMDRDDVLRVRNFSSASGDSRVDFLNLLLVFLLPGTE